MALMLLSLVPSVHADSTPRADIVRFDSPAKVSAGESFNVNVSIRYSYEGWTFGELGMFQGNFTNIIDYVQYYLTGDALRNFTLSVTPPTGSSELQLELVTRFWYQNFWLIDEKGYANFTVTVLGDSTKSRIKEPSIIEIGQNEWHYWNNNATDTLIIWLSGGQAFSDHVTTNPFEMESFGAMMYVNDLSKRYSVLALLRGSTKYTLAVTSQPFYALDYYPDSAFLEKLHEWSVQQGYAFTYLIGYSTGGLAAGYEVTVRDPETWAAPDGALIISAPLGGLQPGDILDSLSHAQNLTADIALFYGGIWSDDLWPQGKQFYDNAPKIVGGDSWYRKEWRFFPDSSHGVWVKEHDGAHYDGLAYSLTSQFIEKSRNPWRRLSKWKDEPYFALLWQEPVSETTSGVSSHLSVETWLYDTLVPPKGVIIRRDLQLYFVVAKPLASKSHQGLSNRPTQGVDIDWVLGLN
jgi:hypothetical protein